jgi:hypothetical protein
VLEDEFPLSMFYLALQSRLENERSAAVAGTVAA